MKRKLRSTIVSIGIVLGILITWGVVEPYFITIKTEKAPVKNLPPSWNGEKIAVVGDFQVGMWMDNTSTIKRIADKILEIKPSVVLLLGDYVYHPTGNVKNKITQFTNTLQPLLNGNIPTFAVLGNHDYAMDTYDDSPNKKIAKKVKKVLDNQGIQVLTNKALALNKTKKGVAVGKDNSNSLFLVGIGAAWPDHADPEKVFNQIDKSNPRIVMMHNPEVFKDINPDTSSFAVAGHTHGSQIRIPFISKWFYTNILDKEQVHYAGWIDDYGKKGNNLYVNPGVGFSNIPIRINCPPEITVFTLSNA